MKLKYSTIKKSLKNNLELFTSTLVVGIVAFALCLNYKESIVNFSYGLIVFCLIIITSLTFKTKFKHLWPIGIVTTYYFIGNFIKNFQPEFWQPRSGILAKILGTSSQQSYFNFIDKPLLVMGLSLSLGLAFLNWQQHHQVSESRPPRLTNWLKLIKAFFQKDKVCLAISLAFSVLLSSYYSFLGYLSHKSFQTHVYDFGIHDQNLYMLSRFKLPPVSTTHQFTSLWYDHQHFSQILISPLYWIGNGFGGILLTLITPFILITIPSIAIYLTSRVLNSRFNLWTGNQYWIIGFTSFLMWLHPYTQSAIKFTFHEKYLINLFFAFILYFGVKALSFGKVRDYILATLFTVIWFGVKEDQWVFAIVFWLQLLIWQFILVGRKNLSSTLKSGLFAVSNIILALVYSFGFLAWFKKDNATNVHLNSYSHLKTIGKELIETGNKSKALDQLGLFEDVQKYLYQNFLVFDLPGIIALPFNIIGNYAERLLSSGYAYKNPVFHYGSEVPFYSVIGIIATFMIVTKFKPLWGKMFLVYALFSYIIGFGMILGWNNNNYLALTYPKVKDDYLSTEIERNGFESIIKLIPDNASLVTTANYAPHLTSRNEIINWPKSIDPSYDKNGNIDPENYQYWLLPKQDKLIQTKYDSKIIELKFYGAETISENDYQILLKKL